MIEAAAWDKKRRTMASLVGSCDGLVVVDIGCADGVTTSSVIKGKPKYLLGLDITPHNARSWYSRSATIAKAAVFVVADISNLPVRFADLIIASEVIEHVDKQEFRAFLVAASQALPPTGRLIISTPRKSAILAGVYRAIFASNRLKLIFRPAARPHDHGFSAIRQAEIRFGQREHVNIYSRRELKRCLIQEDFEIVRRKTSQILPPWLQRTLPMAGPFKRGRWLTRLVPQLNWDQLLVARPLMRKFHNLKDLRTFYETEYLLLHEDLDEGDAAWKSDHMHRAAQAACAGEGPLLEVGCGSGIVGQLLARELGTGVVGLDLSHGIATRARGNGVPVVVGAAEFLPFRDRCARLVVCSDVLEHLNAPVEALRQMARVGPILVWAPIERGLLADGIYWWRRWRRKPTNREAYGHIQRMSLVQYRRLIQEAKIAVYFETVVPGRLGNFESPRGRALDRVRRLLRPLFPAIERFLFGGWYFVCSGRGPSE